MPADKERKTILNKQYYEQHKEERKKKMLEYAKENKEKIKLARQKKNKIAKLEKEFEQCTYIRVRAWTDKEQVYVTINPDTVIHMGTFFQKMDKLKEYLELIDKAKIEFVSRATVWKNQADDSEEIEIEKEDKDESEDEEKNKLIEAVNVRECHYDDGRDMIVFDD